MSLPTAGHLDPYYFRDIALDKIVGATAILRIKRAPGTTPISAGADLGSTPGYLVDIWQRSPKTDVLGWTGPVEISNSIPEEGMAEVRCIRQTARRRFGHLTVFMDFTALWFHYWPRYHVGSAPQTAMDRVSRIATQLTANVTVEIRFARESDRCTRA